MIIKIKLLLLILFVSVSCKQTELISTQNYATDGMYDGPSNGESIAANIEALIKSIKRVDVIAFYETYYFPENEGFSTKYLTNHDWKNLAIQREIINESVSGTAVVVYYDGYLAGLITCAHVVDYPETVYRFYDDNETKVSSISVKIKQQITIMGMQGDNPVEVVATDIKKDLAFLMKKVDQDDGELSPIEINVGTTKKLEWGSEIYVLGYPLGNLMLTKGLVSIDKSLDKRFVSDALFNRGISGSPVFAYLDGKNNLEWVGMASSASAKTIEYLSPVNSDNDSEILSFDNNNIEVTEKLFINYGLTYSIAIEEIITFMARNKVVLRDLEFRTDLLPTRNKTKL